jgi:hypothetical protein
MLTSPRFFRAVIAIATGALVAGGLLADAPANATDTVLTSTHGDRTTVTILLKAPNQAGLDTLATAQGLSHTQRVEALAAVLPTANAHRAVTDELRRHRFTITHETAWTIDAQAPTATVTSLFGAQPALPNTASPTQRARVAGALPRVPAAIASLTAAVLAQGSGPAVFSPESAACPNCLDGAEYRNAYSSPTAVIRDGTDANGPLTIATLQFPQHGGWNDSDLTSYAKDVDLPDPIASGQYTQIPVDGTTVAAATTKEDEADEEVDLDQESILSTDPNADQRAYFDSSSSKAGYADALSQVLADVTQGPGEVGGGDPKIVALSTSWGACESEFSDDFAFPHDTIKAVANILKSLTAAGVTIFASSGDDGVYDCGNSSSSTKIAVDYPASSPQVVGVGGTRLTFTGNSSANDGTNWHDVSWTCTSAPVCQGSKPADTGGSGGGESTLFRMPAYQRAGIGNQPFTTTTGKTGNFGTQPHRLVPDIAADGDPETGFDLLTTDPTNDTSCALGPPPNPLCKPLRLPIGGTSLSSPVAASLFTDMLAAHGVTAGVGDIHGALYSAYAADKDVFRDVTTGRNGKQKNVDNHVKSGGAELPVTAQKGFDTVTGLGAPLWPALAAYIFGPRAPTPTASIALRNPTSAKHLTNVTARWGAKLAAAAASAPAAAAVTITQRGSAKPIFRAKSAAPTGSHTFKGIPGRDYTLSVADTDLAGQTPPAVTASIVIPYDDTSFTFHGVWRRVTGTGDYGGSHSTSVSKHASATIAVKARRYTLEVRTGPTYGKLAIHHGATYLGTYDLYTPSVTHRLIAFYGTSTSPVKRRTFTFRAEGKKNTFSTGTHIDLDALIR